MAMNEDQYYSEYSRYGSLSIQAPEVPDRLQSVFPQMGDVWGDEEVEEGIQGLALPQPLTAGEIEILEAAKAAGEIAGYTYTPPQK